MSKIKVGVNGYGTIGKRVASAIIAQDDMELVGVTKIRPTFEAELAISNGYDVYVPYENMDIFDVSNIKVAGTNHDLYKKADIIIDCTPKNIGSTYKEQYLEAGVKAIFQGGEDHSLTGISFNSSVNYSKSWGVQLSRVVSCNTTGLLRTLGPIDSEIKIKKAFVTIVRRAADPGNSKDGPINGLEPSVDIPTHHGLDVNSIMPWLDINTMAIKASTTLMHVHAIVLILDNKTTTDKIIEILSNSPRIKFVESKYGINTTAQVMELARDLGRNRSDMYETILWKDGIKVIGDTLYYYQAVHQE